MRKKIIWIFSIICIVSIVLFLIFEFAVYQKKYKNHVLKYSEEYGLEISLVYAVIKVESNFDKKARSVAGARGLMQIIPKTGAWIASELKEEFDENKLYDPETNIKYGCFYLKYLFSKFKDVGAVICAYNAGEGVVKNWLNEEGKLEENKITYLETKNYYKKVMGYYTAYKNNEISI